MIDLSPLTPAQVEAGIKRLAENEEFTRRFGRKNPDNLTRHMMRAGFTDDLIQDYLAIHDAAKQHIYGIKTNG